MNNNISNYYPDGEANFWVNLNDEDLGIFNTYDEARASFEEVKAKELKARAEGATPRKIALGWVFEYIEEI